MRTNEDIEGFMLTLELPFESIDEGLWRVSNEHDHVDNLIIYHLPPIITFRVKLMEIPEENQTQLFKTLLTLNAEEMIAGAYGLEDNAVVMVDTLQSENLDLNEFQASIEALSLAIAEHYPRLREFRTKAAPASGSQPAAAAE